jgi:hypothetical protein
MPSAGLLAWDAFDCMSAEQMLQRHVFGFEITYLDELPTLLSKQDHLCHHKAYVATPSAILSLQNWKM